MPALDDGLLGEVPIRSPERSVRELPLLARSQVLGTLCATSIAFGCGTQPPAQPNDWIVFSAEVVPAPAPGSLRVCVRPMSQSLTILASELPWASRYSMFLAAFRSSSTGNDPLKARLPVSDPSFRQTTIPIGELRCGQVSLEERFEGWEAAVSGGDVHLFWAWRAMIGTSDRWFTGGVTVRQSPGTPPPTESTRK